MKNQDHSDNDSVYFNYLHDLGILMKEYALEAKKKADASKGTESHLYETGYTMGFHRVISLMIQQAHSFGLKLEDLGLEGIDADRDLV